MAMTLEVELGIQQVPVELVDAGPNDRQVFDPAGLEELAASIQSHGLAQPPTLRAVGDRFEIVAGERRTRAMRDVLGWKMIPAIVRDLDDEAAAAVMLVENVQRADLDPIEEARAYSVRMQRFGQSAGEVAAMASVPVSRVRSRLPLLRLSASVAHWVSTRQMPLGFAALMVDLDPNRQQLALQAFQDAPMSVATFGALCSRLQAEQDADPLFDPAAFWSVEEYVTDALKTVETSSTLDEVDADPVGVSDIAERLGVKTQTVAQWKLRGLLPEPRWTVSKIPAWQWPDIEKWARETGRLA